MKKLKREDLVKRGKYLVKLAPCRGHYAVYYRRPLWNDLIVCGFDEKEKAQQYAKFANDGDPNFGLKGNIKWGRLIPPDDMKIVGEESLDMSPEQFHKFFQLAPEETPEGVFNITAYERRKLNTNHQINLNKYNYIMCLDIPHMDNECFQNYFQD